MNKLAIISHCILNQNIRASQVLTDDTSKDLVKFLIDNNFDIIQLSCPEIQKEHITREKHGITFFLKDSEYKDICKKIINDHRKIIDYYNKNKAYVCFIGVQGSPTCNTNIRGWRDLRNELKGEKMRGVLFQEIHKLYPNIDLFNLNTGKYFQKSFLKITKEIISKE